MVTNARKTIYVPLISACLVFFIYSVLCHLQGVVFFSDGNRTLAYADAYFQYLDFYAWLKDVFDGKQTIAYTFNCSLGQGAIGLYSYYLASPFNLLLALFNKTQLQEFYNLTVGLKLSVCAGAMGLFLNCRYENLRAFWCVLLSACYGLMTYSFEQAGNLMWLDGVYMLPIIALGVYHFTEKKESILLSISVACSVLFNWYTGGINCIAAGVLFIAEYCRRHEPGRWNFSEFIFSFLRFCGSVFEGLLISAVLFLPTVLSLREGRGSNFDWEQFSFKLMGAPWSFVKAYSIGEKSECGYPALFCGSLVLIGCISYFTLKNRSKYEKTITFGLLVMMMGCFYWRPLFMVFSLFKDAGSYWYRYAYVIIFVFIMVAAGFYQNISYANRLLLGIFLGSFLVLELILNSVSKHNDEKMFLVGLMSWAILTITVFVLIPMKGSQLKKSSMIVGAAVIACITILELSCNAYKLTKIYSYDNAREYGAYNENGIQLIDSVKDMDPDVYRITQTMTRSMNYQSTTANYNESMAFNYMSIENYTSCPQNTQLSLLGKMGYPTYYGCFLAKNTFLLPVDSLFAVRYLLSPYRVQGLEKTEIEEKNGKEIYSNPFALPFAFRIKSDNARDFISSGLLQEEKGTIPFEYWNRVYSVLSNETSPIMNTLEFTENREETGIQYKISLPDGAYAIYGNLPWTQDVGAKLNLNDVFSIPYARWQAVNAFYIPTESGQRSATVTYIGDPSVVEEAQFYSLDLEAFRRITTLIQNNAADEFDITRSQVKIHTSGDEGDLLFTSVPYDKGWKIKRNGRDIEPIVFEECLMSIPLEAGENDIEMNYRIPGLKLGVLLTWAGLFIQTLMIMQYRAKHRR